MMMKNTILHYTSEGACLFSGDTQFQLHSKTQRLSNKTVLQNKTYCIRHLTITFRMNEVWKCMCPNAHKLMLRSIHQNNVEFMNRHGLSFLSTY